MNEEVLWRNVLKFFVIDALNVYNKETDIDRTMMVKNYQHYQFICWAAGYSPDFVRERILSILHKEKPAGYTQIVKKHNGWNLIEFEFCFKTLRFNQTTLKVSDNCPKRLMKKLDAKKAEIVKNYREKLNLGIL